MKNGIFLNSNRRRLQHMKHNAKRKARRARLRKHQASEQKTFTLWAEKETIES